MTITAQDLLHRVTDQLQDPTSVRWPIDELVRYFNDGQRELATLRPDAYAKGQTIALAAGAGQTLPSGAMKLIRFGSNPITGKAIRMVSMDMMDLQMADWRSLPQTSNILHAMYDERTPRDFLVYPPATAGTQLTVYYVIAPPDIAQPGLGKLWSDVSSSPLFVEQAGLTLSDAFGNALQAYVLYRAYSKDAEYADNAQKAQAAYALFVGIATGERKGTSDVSPLGSVAKT